MKKLRLQVITFAAVTGFVTLCANTAFPQEIAPLDQPEFPRITRQPEDQAICLGSNTTFTVQALNGDSYQWARNGVAMEGQTNSSLTIEQVRVDDVGLYTCYVIKDAEAVPTRTATLNVYTASALGGGPITVYGAPVVSGGNQGNCPGAYAGYVNYIKTVSQGWGWAPTAGTSLHTASDGNRTDTKVVYIGKYGDGGCNQTSVTVPHPTYSPKYRFSIYFPDNVPTNSYAITLVGFDP